MLVPPKHKTMQELLVQDNLDLEACRVLSKNISIKIRVLEQQSEQPAFQELFDLGAVAVASGYEIHQEPGCPDCGLQTFVAMNDCFPCPHGHMGSRSSSIFPGMTEASCLDSIE